MFEGKGAARRSMFYCFRLSVDFGLKNCFAIELMICRICRLQSGQLLAGCRIGGAYWGFGAELIGYVKFGRHYKSNYLNPKYT